MSKIVHYKKYVLRAGLAFVFIWFGYKTLTSPAMFESLVPLWTKKFIDTFVLLKIHGIFEIVFGALLLFGWKLRIVSGLLLLSLLGTIFSLKYGPVMVRDIGLAMALLSIFLDEQFSA